MTEQIYKGIRPDMPMALTNVKVNHVPTTITFALKDRHRMQFWYMIQRPCPRCKSGWHWEMFDIRWFIAEQEWLQITNQLFPMYGDILKKVLAIVTDQEVFREISNHLFGDIRKQI
jgi:hypothetical protein